MPTAPNWEHYANDAALALTTEFGERLTADGTQLTDQQLANLCVQTSNAIRSAIVAVATAALEGCDVTAATELEDVPKVEPLFGSN